MYRIVPISNYEPFLSLAFFTVKLNSSELFTLKNAVLKLQSNK